MNRKELIEEVAASHPTLTKKDITSLINTTLNTIATNVKKGNDVRLSPFGTFTKRKTAARNGVNPATGERIKIAEKIKPVFRPSKEFKEMLQ